jgi:hypothetical protein
MNGKLQTILMNLDEASNPDEVITFESVHDVGHVIPHPSFDIAGAIAKNKRQSGFARFLLPYIFLLD